MMEYNDIKDIIIYDDPLFGNISLDFIVNSIDLANQQQKEFENIVYSILKNTNMSDRNISSLFNLSYTDTIDMYLKMLKDQL